MGIQFYEAERIFKLDAFETSYVIQVIKEDFLGQAYFGAYIPECDLKQYISYEQSNFFSLPLVYPCGRLLPYGTSCIQVVGDAVIDTGEMRYRSHCIYTGKPLIPGVLTSFCREDDCETLEIICENKQGSLEARLYFTVFERLNVITCHTKVKNLGKQDLIVSHALSLGIEFAHSDWELIGFDDRGDGTDTDNNRMLHPGKYQQDFIGDGSKGQEIPFMALATLGVNDVQGEVYGFNLVYSEDFHGMVEVSALGVTRMMIGITSQNEGWHLEAGECLVTPESVMMYAYTGLGGIKKTLCEFYSKHVRRGNYGGNKQF